MSGHFTARVLEVSQAALAAQEVRAKIIAGEATPDAAWLVFCELASSHTWKSAACRAFVRELAKREGVAA